MIRKFAIPVTLASLVSAHSIVAHANEGRWTTTVWAGPVFTPEGTMYGGGSADIADLGTLDPSLADSSGSITANHLSFGKVFRTGAALGAEMTYGASQQFEPFVRLSYSRLGGDNLTLGEITSASVATPAKISANFDSLNSSSLVVGARYFFQNASALEPFVSGYVGVNHTDTLYADIAVPDLAVREDRRELIPNATHFAAGIDTGVSYALGDSASLRFSVGADRVATHRATTAAFDSLGIDGARLSERRWTIPAALGVTYRF